MCVMLSMIISSIPAFSQVAIASMYLSGLYGASKRRVLNGPRFEYREAESFSVSMTAILRQS